MAKAKKRKHRKLDRSLPALTRNRSLPRWLLHGNWRGSSGRLDSFRINRCGGDILGGGNLWGRKHRGHGVLEQTANDFAPLRDVPGETSWFLYGSDGCKQQNGKTDHEKRHKVFRTF